MGVLRLIRQQKHFLPGKYIRVIAACLIAIAFLFPLYISWNTSLLTKQNLFTYPPHLLPNWDFDNYIRAWHMGAWLMYFGNSLFITLTTLAIALTTSVLAAYALSMLHFKGREWLFFAILFVLMVPAEALLIPNYIILNMMHLINTYWAQILPYGASAFGVFLLRQVFLSIPSSYWDAARLDGAGHMRFLWSIALPMARPTLYTIGLYISIGAWNSFMWPLMVTSSPNVQPIEVEVSRLMISNSVDWRRLSAIGVFATIPLVIVFLVLQKYIIQGISRGEGIQG